MSIIAVASRKGGVGKSSVAVHLAWWWKRRLKRDVVAIDCDVQQTLADHRLFNGKRGSVELRVCATSDIMSVLPINRTVIVDLPPSLESAAPVLKLADLVLLPVRPAIYDARATIQAVDVLSAQHPNKTLRIVINGYVARRASHKQLRAALESECAEYLCRAIIPHSYEVEDAALLGKTVFDAVPESRIARQYAKLAVEIDSLVKSF